MNWEYRVMRTVDKETGEDRLGIHELYLAPDGSVQGLTTEPLIPVGATLEQLREDLQLMLGACDKLMLDATLPPRRGMVNPYKKAPPAPGALQPIEDEAESAA